MERRIRTNSMEGYMNTPRSPCRRRMSYLSRRISAMPLSAARARESKVGIPSVAMKVKTPRSARER